MSAITKSITKKNFCALGAALLIPVLIFAALEFFNVRFLRKVTPPHRVTNLQNFLDWNLNPRGAERVTVSNEVFYQIYGEQGPFPASGPASYLFNQHGRLIFWTGDSGDAVPPQFSNWSLMKTEKMSLKEVKSVARELCPPKP